MSWQHSFFVLTFSLTRLLSMNLLIQANVLVALFKLRSSKSWCWISSIVCFAAFKIYHVSLFFCFTLLTFIAFNATFLFDLANLFLQFIISVFYFLFIHDFQYRLYFVELVHTSPPCWWKILYTSDCFSSITKQNCYLFKDSLEQQNISEVQIARFPRGLLPYALHLTQNKVLSMFVSRT